MPVNPYDQASRYTAKLNAVGLLCWLLNEDAATLGFHGWLDTRTLPFPGDPERTCDTVAWLGDADSAQNWALSGWSSVLTGSGRPDTRWAP